MALNWIWVVLLLACFVMEAITFALAIDKYSRAVVFLTYSQVYRLHISILQFSDCFLVPFQRCPWKNGQTH